MTHSKDHLTNTRHIAMPLCRVAGFGAVGGVLRQIPPTIVTPIILASAATSNLLGGVRSQLVPDTRREAALKWRDQDNT
ncbi:Autophagy protein [Homalodisca vitripennis]|nr:Autophagy protein [Homalodisca vitripennis]